MSYERSRYLGGLGVRRDAAGISSLDQLGSWLTYWLAPNVTPTTGLPADVTQCTDSSGNANHWSLVKTGNEAQVTTTGVPTGIARMIDIDAASVSESVGHLFAAPATVSAWTTSTMWCAFKLNVDKGSDMYPLSLCSNFANREIALRVQPTTLELDLYLDRPTGAAGTWGKFAKASPYVLSLGTPYLAFVVHDGATARIYVNGANIGAVYSKSGTGPAESNWLAASDQQHTAINVGARVEGDLGAIGFGMDGGSVGAGIMQAPLAASKIALAHAFLWSALKMGSW